MFARYPSGFSRNTMIQKLFLRPFVRRRMAASHLGIILEQFALDLQARGYAVSPVQFYVQVTEHFSRWPGGRRLAVREIDERVVDRFVGGHLCRCRCPIPAATTGTICRAALGCFVRFLREQKLPSKSSPRLRSRGFGREVRPVSEGSRLLGFRHPSLPTTLCPKVSCRGGLQVGGCTTQDPATRLGALCRGLSSPS